MKSLQRDREEGSITPLISIYFIILMISIFVVANVASTYISRRELINMTEAALAEATHQLDEMRYYYQLPLPNYLGGPQRQMVPIDCRDAAASFKEAIELHLKVSTEIEPITVLSFDCDGRTIRAKVRRSHNLPFSLPVLAISQFTNEVDVAVSSRYL